MQIKGYCKYSIYRKDWQDWRGKKETIAGLFERGTGDNCRARKICEKKSGGWTTAEAPHTRVGLRQKEPHMQNRGAAPRGGGGSHGGSHHVVCVGGHRVEQQSGAK